MAVLVGSLSEVARSVTVPFAAAPAAAATLTVTFVENPNHVLVNALGNTTR